MRRGRYRCRRGHMWLLAHSFDFVCITDRCTRCGANSTIHAVVSDDLTGHGGGGCVHGTPGVRTTH